MKNEGLHKLLVGKTGEGYAMRQLISYAEHWGVKIPAQLKDKEYHYFSAATASELLLESNKQL